MKYHNYFIKIISTIPAPDDIKCSSTDYLSVFISTKKTYFNKKYVFYYLEVLPKSTGLQFHQQRGKMVYPFRRANRVRLSLFAQSRVHNES